MTHGTHEAAVQLLTAPDRFVRLIVQREVKGPLEPPLSPASPSYLTALSPSGYLANRPGIYKRGPNGDLSTASAASAVSPPNADPASKQFNSTISPQVHSASSLQTTPKTNGVQSNAASQPVPAPRRLTSQSSFGSNGNGALPPSQNGNRSEDDEAQVKFHSFGFKAIRVDSRAINC